MATPVANAPTLAEPANVAVAATAADPTGVGREGARSWLSLVVTPVILAGASLLLYLYVSGADKDSAMESALDWGSKLRPQLLRHLSLTVWSTLLVLAIAVPLGILLTRPAFRRLSGPVLTFANIGQALPAYGLFILMLAWRGQGFRTAVIALVVFAVLPVLRNTMVGLDQVDRAVIEAGRGMGMSKAQVLRAIELPLAVPVILAGVRTALVINIGMATLAFLIGGGGLGITINSGLKLNRNIVTVTAAGMVAILALSIDWVAAVVERLLRPRGI